MIIKNLINIFKKEKPSVNDGFSEFEVNNWEISRFVLKKLIKVVGVSPFPLSELSLLASTVVRFRPDYIFEWGTHIGKSARVFYEVSNYYNIPCEIHSIDLPNEIDHVEHPHEKRGMLVKNISAVTLHQGDGLEVSTKIIESIKNKEAKILFFLDGDHSYDSVKKELDYITKNWTNAIILAHDTFYQSSESGYNIGPWKAVEELMISNPGIYKKIETNLGLPGMTLLYRN